jgi:hypothetical protein
MAAWVEVLVIAVTCGGFVAVPYALVWRPRTAGSLLKVKLENVELRLIKLQLDGDTSVGVRGLLETVRSIQRTPTSAASAPANAAASLSDPSPELAEIAATYDRTLRRFRRSAWPRGSWAVGPTPWRSARELVSCPRAATCTRPGGCPLLPSPALTGSLLDLTSASTVPPPRDKATPRVTTNLSTGRRRQPTSRP